MTIICLFATFMFLNLYSLIVHGLRKVDSTSTEMDGTLECDVLEQYKSIYFYIMLPYVFLSIIVLVLLISYVNISITRVLAKRKNNILNDLNQSRNQQIVATKIKNTKTLSTNRQTSSTDLENKPKFQNLIKVLNL